MAKLGGGVGKCLIFRLRQSFAGDGNGYAVSGVGWREAKGRVDAKLAKMPVVWSGWVAQLAPTLLWRFRLPVRTSASSSIDCLTANEGARVVMPAGSAGNSRESRVRLAQPAGATSTPSKPPSRPRPLPE
jgi:hypothetical protein